MSFTNYFATTMSKEFNRLRVSDADTVANNTPVLSSPESKVFVPPSQPRIFKGHFDAANSSFVAEVDFGKITPRSFIQKKAIMKHYQLQPQPQREPDYKQRKTAFGVRTTKAGDIVSQDDDNRRSNVNDNHYTFNVVSIPRPPTPYPRVPQLAEFTFSPPATNRQH